MCVRVCVSAPQTIKSHSHEMKPEKPIKQVPLLFSFFVIDTIDRWALSNEACCELLPKKSKVIKSFIIKVLEYKVGVN